MVRLSALWHRVALQHIQHRSRVTVALMDPSPGILIRCSCGRCYAL